MRKPCIVAAAIGLIAFSGLALAQSKIVNSWTIEKPFDSIWSAIVETLADMNIPILNMDKASGVIVSDTINLLDDPQWVRYSDCGPKMGVKDTERNGKLNIFLKKNDETSCLLKINAAFSDRYMTWIDVKSPTVARQCKSRGNYEAKIYQALSEKLK